MALTSQPRNLTLESPGYDDDEELSDEQIQQLLNDAERRLRGLTSATASAPFAPADSITEITSTKAQRPSSSGSLPRLKHGPVHAPYIREKSGVAQADPKLMVSDEQRKLANELRSVNEVAKSVKTNDQHSAGPDWFDMPKTVVTPQLKRDFQLLEMRSVLDPHRHYKKDSRKGKLPTFSEVGTVIQGPTEWYSSRINKKDRSKNFVEEAMAMEQGNGRFKRKYVEIQSTKTSGKKAHYKALMAKRKKKS